MKPALKVVQSPPSTESILKEAFAGRDEAMQTVRQYDAIISEGLRALAKERGVIFLRQEAVRREFGL